MLADFLAPFIAVGMAEFADKTQLTILLLSSRTGRRLHLLAGVMLAFLLVDGLAVFAGSMAAGLIPGGVVRSFGGALFILFGILELGGRETGGLVGTSGKGPFLTGFLAVFFAEFGDKTQITAGLLAAKYDAYLVLLGALASLLLLSSATLYFGRVISSKVDGGTISKIAAAVFVIIGFTFLLT